MSQPKPDRSIPWRITGSGALRDAAREAGPGESAFVDRAVRALLESEGRDVPPPLPPKRNGRAPTVKRARKVKAHE